jgi:hypothetical protein
VGGCGAIGNQAARTFGTKVLGRCDGWPVDRFSRIQPAWTGATVYCLGGGPSFTSDHAQRIAAAQARSPAQVRVIAINNAYWLVPGADVLYFADSRWWEWHRQRPDYRAFAGQKCTIFSTGALIDEDGVHILRNASEGGEVEGLSNDPGALKTGCNSGYQALQIALLAGAARVVLCGYDMQYTGGRDHWHGGHPVTVCESIYRGLYAPRFAKAAPLIKVPVIDTALHGALTCFEKAPLESLLPDP